MYRENRLKARLREGRKCLGCWLWLGSADAAEVLALSGFDVLMIDHEHGPGNFKSAIDIMRAAAVGDATLVMRVESDDTAFLKRALDSGVEGVMVPGIETAEQAAAVVNACRYPPLGRRGAAFSATRASDYGLQGAHYSATAADNLILIAQIESATAVSNVEEIAAVDGIDLLFIGPTDLSGSVDKLLQFDDPEVRKLIEKAERGIVQSGKALGGIVMGNEDVVTKFGRGYDLLVASGDVVFLREGAKALRAQIPRE